MKKFELFFTFIKLPVDIAMFIASFMLGYSLRGSVDLGLSKFTSDISGYITLSLYVVPVVVVVYATQGLYDAKLSQNSSREFFRIFGANSVIMSLVVLFLFFSKNTEFSRFILATTWAIGIILVGLGRIIIRKSYSLLINNGIGRKSVVILGTNELAKFVAKQFSKRHNRSYRFRGYLSLEAGEKGPKILGKISSYKEILATNSIDEVIICESFNQKIQEEFMVYCADINISIKYAPILAPGIAIKAHPFQLGPIQMLEVKTTPMDGWGRIIKRFLDIIFSLLLLILFLPVFLVISVIQKITSPGPILYSHQRVGRDGRKFILYKFRSMYHMSEKLENKYWTEKQDNRITPFGNILRKSNLDELPQLYNILCGDMSFVGPRPEQPKFVEEFSKEIPNYPNRHRVKSGLTGWAQVNGLKGDTSISERVRYDIFYVENWSIGLDIKIIFMTIWMVIYELIKGKYEYSSGA